MHKSVKNILVSTALAVVSVTLTIAAAEAILRNVFPTGYAIWKPHMSRTFRPSPDVMPGIAGNSKFQTNSRGLRADELAAAHTHRILALGGSTTECLYLDQSETWPQLLQDTLNASAGTPHTWVGNAGMSGRNSRHHVIALRYLPLDEMKVDTVVLLAGVNDLSLRLSQGDAYDATAMFKPSVRSKLVEETFTGMGYGNPHDPWIKRSYLWQALRKLKVTLNGQAQARPAQDRMGDIYVEWRKHRRDATDIRKTLPDLTAALEEYKNNLKKAAAISRERSVRLVLVTQPSMWKPGLPREFDALLWLGGVGDFQVRPGQPYYSVESLAQGMKQYNDAMLGVCKSEALECIDLANMDKDTTVFYDDVHFNEGGARQVARIIANHMLARPPLSRRM